MDSLSQGASESRFYRKRRIFSTFKSISKTAKKLISLLEYSQKPQKFIFSVTHTFGWAPDNKTLFETSIFFRWQAAGGQQQEQPVSSTRNSRGSNPTCTRREETRTRPNSDKMSAHAFDMTKIK